MKLKSRHFTVVIMVFVFILSPFFTQAFFAYSDGTLIKGSGPEIYVLENGLKRWITTEKIFEGYEYNWNKIQTLSDQDVAQYPTGRKLDYSYNIPEGMLMREDATQGGDGKKVYLVKQGQRRWIETEQDFVNLGLSWEAIMDISPKKMKTIYEGKSLKQLSSVATPLAVLTSTPNKELETITAKFTFTGIAANLDKRDLTFETFVEGIDSGWASVYGKERTVYLPTTAGVQHYTFFIRAKDPDGVVQRNPISYSFTAKFSPYFGKIQASASLRNSNVDQQIVVMQGTSVDPVSISGWTFGSKKYNTQYTVPSVALDVPNHPYFSSMQSNIKLTNKTKLVVHMGRSPLGVDFRLNRCIGYLNSYYPNTVPNYCPSINQDEVKNLSAYCKTVISRTGQCREPQLSDAKIDSECHDYLYSHYTYSQCVVNNNSYYDFYMDEWWTYLNLTSQVWSTEADSLLIKDQNGLLIAEVQY